MNEWNYLSETELQKLIQKSEESSVFQAPSYLEGQILKKAAVQKVSQRSASLWGFTLTIAAAAAASVALLFAMPELAQSEAYLQQAAEVQEDGFLQKINQKTNQFCSLLSDGANFIVRKER